MDYNKIRRLALKLAASPALSSSGRKALNSVLSNLPAYICGEDTKEQGEKLFSLLLDACQN